MMMSAKLMAVNAIVALKCFLEEFEVNLCPVVQLTLYELLTGQNKR